MVSHFDSLTASSPLANVNRMGCRALHLDYVIVTLLLVALFGLDGPWPFFAVLGAAFLIYLFH